MTLIWEKIVVTAKEFLTDKNINDAKEFNEPLFLTKLGEFDWDPSFAAASMGIEIVWKTAFTRNSISEYRRLDKLFSPSPVATYANFRGCKTFRTGNMPQKGAIAFWKRGNSWQGHMALVIEVSEDKQTFDIVEFRMLQGSEQSFLRCEEKKAKRMGLAFHNEKLNLLGFAYPPDREID